MSSNPCIYMDCVGGTIKMADYGNLWLFGSRPKSVCAGLGCSLDIPALSMTRSLT